jgi:hypothetical protein
VRRREFITLLGGSALAWPIAARAQQDGQVRHIGVLMAHTESDPEFQNYLSAFRQALRKLGWIEGRNIRIETRWGALDDADSRQQSAKELLALRPDVILTQNTPLTASMLQHGLDRGSHRRNQALMGGGTQRAYSRDRYRVGREKIDVIVGGGTISVLAAKQVIPIVLVSTGLVVNLARPSGNVAGLSSGAFAH